LKARRRNTVMATHEEVDNQISSQDEDGQTSLVAVPPSRSGSCMLTLHAQNLTEADGTPKLQPDSPPEKPTQISDIACELHGDTQNGTRNAEDAPSGPEDCEATKETPENGEFPDDQDKDEIVQNAIPPEKDAVNEPVCYARRYGINWVGRHKERADLGSPTSQHRQRDRADSRERGRWHGRYNSCLGWHVYTSDSTAWTGKVVCIQEKHSENQS
jgi:hypothetical protein